MSPHHHEVKHHHHGHKPPHEEICERLEYIATILKRIEEKIDKS